MAVVTWISIILIILIIIIIGILVIPFQVSMKLYREGSINQGYLKVKWLGIRIINRKIDLKQSGKSKEKKKEKKNKFDINRIPKIIILIEESLPYLINIFLAFLKSIKIKRIEIDSILGLYDFVDTVKICGYMWAVAPFINLIPNTYFSIEPDFTKERIDGSFIIDIKIKLLKVALASIKAITNKSVRSLLFEMRRVRG